MGWSVVAGDPRTVEAEHHVLVVQADIEIELIDIEPGTERRPILVVSAHAGVTDRLVDLARTAPAGDVEAAITALLGVFDVTEDVLRADLEDLLAQLVEALRCSPHHRRLGDLEDKQRRVGLQLFERPGNAIW